MNGPFFFELAKDKIFLEGKGHERPFFFLKLTKDKIFLEGKGHE